MNNLRARMLIAAGLLAFAPVAYAQTNNSPYANPPPLADEQEAQSACGGGPIQGGKDIQPTPARDRCLEEHLYPDANRRTEELPPPPPPDQDRLPDQGGDHSQNPGGNY